MGIKFGVSRSANLSMYHRICMRRRWKSWQMVLLCFCCFPRKKALAFKESSKGHEVSDAIPRLIGFCLEGELISRAALFIFEPEASPRLIGLGEKAEEMGRN